MKLPTLNCGVFAGIIATITLMVFSLTLFLTGVLPLSISEYAVRFALFLDGQKMNASRWVVGAHVSPLANPKNFG